MKETGWKDRSFTELLKEETTHQHAILIDLGENLSFFVSVLIEKMNKLKWWGNGSRRHILFSSGIGSPLSPSTVSSTQGMTTLTSTFQQDSTDI